MSKELVGMILAGGKGTRLLALTKKDAKPAVSFGGKYSIIDFPLSNCANSGIDTVGVLTQYESVSLSSYIGNGEKWGLNGVHSLTATLPPRQTEEGLSWYRGTADAIYQNISFLDSLDPEYVLILSGDHIYSTTYDKMLELHKERNADCTISVIEVPWEEASRFGILSVDEEGRVTKFSEKPKNPKSNLASMGIYIFTYKQLRKALIADANNENSDHDFGGDIIPEYLKSNKKVYSYVYEGYWKDVGTLSSLHEANMDLLLSSGYGGINGLTKGLKIFSKDSNSTPQYIGKNAVIKDSVINQGAIIKGHVERCVISNEVIVEDGAFVYDSVIMPNTIIKKGSKVYKAILAPNTTIDKLTINKDGENVVLVTGKGTIS